MLAMRKVTLEWLKSRCDCSSGCWVWTGSRTRKYKGYGQTWYGGRKTLVHRVAAELSGMDLSTGLLVLHKCDNPLCCNPDHLFLGTTQDNSDDMIVKGRLVTLRGDERKSPKLREDQVLEIRKIYSEGGVTQRQLAKKYNVDQRLIWGVVNREFWKHI